MKLTSSHRGRHALWGAAIGLAAAALFSVLSSAGLIDTLEYRTYDGRMAIARHAPKGSGANVAMLYVDEPSLATMKEMGISWPWPRELYASVLDFCRRGGARAVLFDLFFSEDSSYGVADDEAFAGGIAQGPPTYLVFFASKNEGQESEVGNEILSRGRFPFKKQPPAFLPEVSSLQSVPVPVLAKPAAGFGNAQTAPDADGIFRRLPPAVRLGDSVLPQAAFEVAASVGGFGSVDLDSPDELRIDGKRVPLDGKGNLLINYIGGVDSYPVYPLAKVLISAQQLAEGKAPDLDPAVLKDRTVIIGLTAPGLYDLKPMPLSRVYPGPEVHATVIDSLLRSDFLRPVHGIPAQLLVFALALIAALGLSQCSRLSQIVPWLLGTAGAYVALAILLFFKGIVLPMVAPLAAAALAAFAMILRQYLTEGRRRKAIKRAFGQYLAPEVVSRIAADPDNVRMGGEEEEVSVFFSDIADFTTISEGMAPTELVEKLCAYLTEVTAIITERQGTLDKYIGDAVMAFWGAPLRFPDHAAKAALAALEVQRALGRFPQFVTRIGIHTGRCVIGNIGSDLRFNYTAMGDTVNLASRLEGLNKQFGTRIILSESAYQQAREAVEARLIGRVRVKGRAQPIAIYEPLGEKGRVEERVLAARERFDAAMALFFEGDFKAAAAAFAGLLANQGVDSVVASYKALCDKYALSPPAAPFDGVITFKEK